jgi:hypothetical protein
MIRSGRQKPQGRPATFLPETVQYWTAIYPRLADHRFGKEGNVDEATTYLSEDQPWRESYV